MPLPTRPQRYCDPRHLFSFTLGLSSISVIHSKKKKRKQSEKVDVTKRKDKSTTTFKSKKTHLQMLYTIRRAQTSNARNDA